MKGRALCWNGEPTIMMNDWLERDPAIFEQCRRNAEKEVDCCPLIMWPLEWGNSELEAVAYRMGENLHDKMRQICCKEAASTSACWISRWSWLIGSRLPASTWLPIGRSSQLRSPV